MTRRSRCVSPAVDTRRRALARSPEVCAHTTLRRDTRRIPQSLIDRHRPRHGPARFGEAHRRTHAGDVHDSMHIASAPHPPQTPAASS
jgi:hypothetical protein